MPAASAHARADRYRELARHHGPVLATVAFLALLTAGACLAGQCRVAVYAASFWHYYLYWLAWAFAVVPLAVFTRDAILMKSVALAMLGCAYFTAPPDVLSLAVVGAGFLLNCAAARALGSERTYFGHELAGLPARRITAFPYCLVPHPMLVGNAVAFAGTMINEPFRAQWWPLASAHVAMNVGLLVMELAMPPGFARARTSGRQGWVPGTGLFAAAGAVLGGAAASVAAAGPSVVLGAGAGAGVLGCARMIHCRYASAAR